MGRAIAMVFFFLAFVVFAFVKMAGRGVKAAYEAVFDPNSNNEHIKKLSNQIFLVVNEKVSREYTTEKGCMERIITELVPTVHSICVAAGFNISHEQSFRFVMSAIEHGHPHINLYNLWPDASRT